MRIDELKKIAEENGYEYEKSFGEHDLLSKDNINKIIIHEHSVNAIFIRNTFCTEKDLKMIKAAVSLLKLLSRIGRKRRSFI